MLSCCVSLILANQSTITEYKDLVYEKVGSVEVKLNIAQPRSSAPTPVMILVHGGGWVGGTREQIDSVIPGFTSIGMACVNVDFRPAPAAPYPAQLEDLKAGVRWVKENARKYNFNPNQIATMGISSGGHLAMLLATTGQERKWDLGSKYNSSVAAAISLDGPMDLPTMWRHRQTQTLGASGVIETGVPALLGGTLEQKPAMYKDASPIFHVTLTTAPTLLLHGEDDSVVLKEQSEIMYRILQAQGVPSEIMIIPNAIHEELGDDRSAVSNRMISFLRKSLKL